MFKSIHIKKGEQAESLSLKYLQQQGLKLLSKNFSCRFGEIDMIMLDNNDLVFVEVRYRKDTRFGGAIASVNLSKQCKIRSSAEYYLQQNPGIAFHQCRFDVVAVSSLAPELKLEWIQDAF